MNHKQWQRKVDTFLEVISGDRKRGVTLWQILLMIPGEEENRFIITEDPERFIVRLHAGEIKCENLPDNDFDTVGILVLPITFGESCPDKQMIAVLTLPRDRVLTREQAVEWGITVDDFPQDQWQKVLKELS